MPAKLTTEEKWPAALRGNIISRVMHKNIYYVGLADRRAQVMITINSFLIPLSLAVVEKAEFRLGILVLILFAVLSMLFAIISLMPKKFVRKRHKHPDLFHHSHIQTYTEKDYLANMAKLFVDPNEIGRMAAYDIYHMSTYVLKPKFKWLKYSYFTFLLGLISASGVVFWMSIF